MESFDVCDVREGIHFIFRVNTSKIFFSRNDTLLIFTVNRASTQNSLMDGIQVRKVFG